MDTQKLDTAGLFSDFDKTMDEFKQLLASFNQQEINTIPFEGSWTPAQVAIHVTKAYALVTGSLQKQGFAADRQPNGMVAELDKTFLDFDTKMNSPDSILPEPGTYQRETIISEFEQAVALLKEKAVTVDLAEMIEHRIFKKITKYELVYFMIIHTKRHAHQLGKIRAALN